MKKGLLLSLSILAVTGLSAQDYDSSIKRWKDGPLTWEDFSTYSGGFPIISSMDYGWHFNTDRYKTGNLRVLRNLSECYMNPITSWVNPDHRNPQTLRYQQVAFDYAELCRRQLQKELDNNTNGHNPNELNNFYYGKVDRFIARLREETDQGRDTAMVNFFAVQTAEELAATPEEFIEEPGLSRKAWGIGIHFGYGCELRLGNAAGYIRPEHGLQWGFDISYRKVSFYWHMLLAGGGRNPQTFTHEGNVWSTDEYQSGGNMEFDLAYPVIDNHWLNISPFAGIGVGFVNSVIGQDDNGKNITDAIGGLRYQAGLSISLKFLRTLDLTNRPVYYYGVPIGNSRGYNENSLRLLAYAAHTAMDHPVGPSWSLNFGLVYNIHTWNLR